MYETKRYINSLDDLLRYVGDGMDGMDMTCYALEYDQLQEAVTADLVKYLYELNFSWGDEIPSQLDDFDLFYGFFQPYEITMEA